MYKRQAQKLIEDAKAVEEAGACMVVLECVPAKLAKKITEMLKEMCIRDSKKWWRRALPLGAND